MRTTLGPRFIGAVPPEGTLPGSLPAAQAQQAQAQVSTTMKVVGAASALACTYHGYKRNNSIVWALAWGAAGGLFPFIAPVIAFAQGFGKKA